MYVDSMTAKRLYPLCRMLTIATELVSKSKGESQTAKETGGGGTHAPE